MRHSLLHAVKSELSGNAYLACFAANTIVALCKKGVSGDLLEVLRPAVGDLSKKLLQHYTETAIKEMYLRQCDCNSAKTAAN